MKEQGTPLHGRLSEEMSISGEVVSVMPDHSQSLGRTQNNIHPDYVQLKDMSAEKRRTHLTTALNILTALGISEEALRIGQPLKALLAKETSCSRYFRWAVVDNLAEKILQGLVLNKQDISQEDIKFCTGMIRQVPVGRSLLLHQACGLRKVYAARGLILTTEMVLNEAFQIFVAVSLSYRLYEWLTTGTSSFLEFTTIFEANNSKGVSSLVHLLANFDPEWLYLLLTSPAIAGVLKGLWDTQKSQPLTESAITQLQEAVNHHTNALLKKSYFLWRDVLRQMIPMPGLSSVSERVQRAEQQIRWDGRITNAQRALLFSNIERLALQGSGMSKINAMQSLAKIVHSLSINDFHRLQDAGYSQETLIQILRIKTQALRDLRMLSNRAPLQPMQEEQSPTATLNQSRVSTLYATYLLWWLGMGQFKYSALFWSFKLGKLTFEGLFLKTLVESILEVINCPDKKGFRMFFGDYEIWANELTSDCFNEFVKQFRFIYQDEPLQPFLDQLNNFDLREVESVDLGSKALTSNEIREILNIFNEHASIKMLNLTVNKINDTTGLLFPNSLQSLDLSSNNIANEGAMGLQLPPSLQSLDLSQNSIGAEGAKGLQLPTSLQSLNLDSNHIGDEGAKGLQLPSMLTSLDLSFNSIGDEGVAGLLLPLTLTSLNLGYNNIGAEGAKELQLPSMLTSLNLGYNYYIGDEGVKGLQLPSSLQSLILWDNNIGAEGAKGLQLPSMLTSLDLYQNNIGAEGAKGLQLPSSLKSLSLDNNGIGDEGAKGLQLPSMLTSLNLQQNNIGAEGVNGLQLPSMLQSLNLFWNNIGNDGAKGLQLPSMLQSLNLGANNIDEGAEGIQLPASLQSLALGNNNIGDEGAKRLQLPSSLQSLDLSVNSIGAEGAKGLQLPASLQSLDLGSNYEIGAEGAKGLPLLSLSSLTSLSLWGNNIGAEGAKGLQLPSSLQSLNLPVNNISDEGAKGLQLPASLQSLDLWGNNIGDEGTKGLQLPTSLQSLDLTSNSIGDEGAKGLQLPPSLQFLYLPSNNIGDEGVNALLQKIPRTNLTTITLGGNPYNSSTINVNRTLQQKRLLKNCQDKLCHVNTPLWQQDDSQTSSATRAQPSLFFSGLKKSFDKLAEYANGCMSETFGSLGARLEKVVSHSPSYFPNIHSPEISDWQPSGSVMLHQFNGASNTLLLSAPQTAVQPYLRSIAR